MRAVQKKFIAVLLLLLLVVTAFAACKKETYTVSFDANGGTGAPAAITNIAKDATINKPSKEPTYAGHTFRKWYKESACTTEWKFATDKVAASMTLYAGWDVNAPSTYSVSFNANAGSDTVTGMPNTVSDVVSGAKIAEPASRPVRSGYTFTKWYKESACTSEWNFNADTVSSNTTLYAGWNAETPPEPQAPQITNVKITSDNITAGKIAIGDTITLTFTADEEVEKLGSFKILSSNVTLERVGTTGWAYKATHEVDQGSIDAFNNGAPLFQINVKSKSSGLYSVTVEETSDGSTVAIIAPQISAVSIITDNITAGKIAIGDTITLTFTVDEEVEKLGSFKILSSNVTLERVGTTGWAYKATHEVDQGSIDAFNNGAPLFQINVKSKATGLYSVTVEETSDGSTVATAGPQISAVSITSDNTVSSKIAIGDIITLTFTADEEVEKLGSFKILSSNVTLERVGTTGWNYKATHEVDQGSIDAFNNGAPLFQINVKSKATGLYSVTVEETSDGSAIALA